MKFKKLVIGFVIALSAAFALNAVSQTTPRDNNLESADQHQTLLFTDSNEITAR